jgi:hypothetical protein
MKRYLVLTVSTFGLLLAGVFAQAGAQTTAKVCGDPAAPCKSAIKAFAPYELSFQLPRRVKPNLDYKSALFFGIVLRTSPIDPDTECDEGEYSSKLEKERKRVQLMFPERKVFADNQCPDMGAVAYVVNGSPNTSTLLAIYGGESQAEAEQVLAKVKARYPKAAVKRMQVVFQQIEQ